MKIFAENLKARRRQETAFTITEVVVSALIFAIATAGIMATASSMRKPAVESSEDVAAAFLAKRILDGLRSQLAAGTWNQVGGNFDTSVSNHVLNPITLDGTVYTPWYTIETDPQGTQARKVNLTVTW